jgi:(E)-2-((N-methylformamido)methylene)succinate hydrolase
VVSLEEAQRNLLSKVALMNGAEDPLVEGETAVIEGGEGRPLLLVHGGLGDSFARAPILPSLARSFHVVAVDLPVHGLADSFEFQSEDLLALMSTFLGEVTMALDLDQVAICASSLRGLFSSRFLVDESDRVSRLVVLGCRGATSERFLCR